ncbi:Hydrolase [Acidisarcina polymorpha]|uniref:Hydrolase n=1 Tax=Acidisarcina polymorpha TaxID=2211140 RepID=A0A2Z5FZA7_9BACT|nr:alpha/beta hydrolase [Acidisarcina polymorpha]AXC12178.1 Hydrolase [Acidisarcina polymorpha]
MSASSLMALTIPTSALAQTRSILDTEWYSANRRFATLPMGRIAYLERGHGPRAALFLHGFPLNSFQWRGALERLSPYRRCIAPDLMGMGYSEGSDEQDITPATQVEMLASLLDYLKVQDVDVVANDAGGLVAQLLIARHPKRVRTLLLSNCDVDTNNPPEKFLPAVALAKRHMFAERYVTPQLANKQLARSVKGIGGQYTHPDSLTDSTIDMYFTPLIASPARKIQLDRYTVALGDSVLVPIRSDLERWKNPVRIVWALKDSFFGVEWAEWLDHRFSGSRGIRRLEDANLFFPEEMPDLIAEEAQALWAYRPRSRQPVR